MSLCVVPLRLLALGRNPVSCGYWRWDTTPSLVVISIGTRPLLLWLLELGHDPIHCNSDVIILLSICTYLYVVLMYCNEHVCIYIVLHIFILYYIHNKY